MEQLHGKPQNGPSRRKPPSRPPVTPSRSVTPPPRKPAGPTPELLFLNEVADELRLSPTTVKRMIKAGELVSMRVGGQVRISRFDLRAMLRAARDKKPDAPPPRLMKAERPDASYAELIGLAMLDKVQQGRAVYAASVEALEQDTSEFLVRVRPDQARSEPAARALITALRGEYLRHRHKPPSLAQPHAVHTAWDDVPKLEQDEERDDLEAAELLEEDEPEDDTPLLESDAEEMLDEEEREADLTPEERAERREGDPQYEP
ncbi:MAG TPA: helix-turn-helix domain-containing protein [Polyangiaceae bacterium]|nr:helix-turn-helix domain-containing protein [Polyangiaceae bacterium]